MTKGVLFDTLHTARDLGLILQTQEIEPAQPKTSYVDIPGADGSLDLTEALGVGVKFSNRTITWVFALYPGTDWAAKQTEVSNAVNGLDCTITLDDDPGHYYEGRVIVESYKSDKLLRQITIKANCKPYKYHGTETVVTRDDLSTSYKTLNLECDRMAVIPSIKVTAETTLKFGSAVITVNKGTHRLPEIMLTEGTNRLQAKLVSTGEATSGSITVTYLEGAL